MIYLLDTNTISDWLERQPKIIQQIEAKIEQNHILAICSPVHYELLRGLLRNNQANKQKILQNAILPLLDQLDLTTDDWLKAAQLWATMRSQGRQFSDVDLLLASVTMRLNAILVSSDNDFDPLPIKREDWR